MKVTIEIPDLELQEQPIGSSVCTQTCIAMAISTPLEKVVKRYGDAPMDYLDLVAALRECGVCHTPLLFGTIVFQGWYFACVPSLNLKGTNHSILFRWTDTEGLYILDPAAKRKYKQDGSNFKSWSELIAFIPGGRLPQKKA